MIVKDEKIGTNYDPTKNQKQKEIGLIPRSGRERYL